MVVKKWVASFWMGKIHTALIAVKETPKMWCVLNDDLDQLARDYTRWFKRNPPELFDTEKEALINLHNNLVSEHDVTQGKVKRIVSKIAKVSAALGKGR